MLREIPLNRLALYFASLLLLPAIFVGLQLQSRFTTLTDLSNRLNNLHELAVTKQSKQSLNRRIRANYAAADRFYIDKKIESLSFLQPEIHKLEQSIEQEDVGENEAVIQRLDYLKSPENQIRFSEGAVASYEGVQDTPEKMQGPVQLNLDDLQKLLSIIQGEKIGPHEVSGNPPLLLIQDFRLERKTVVGDHEVMSLLLKLIKREFT
jgi:hypothetical protein